MAVRPLRARSWASAFLLLVLSLYALLPCFILRGTSRQPLAKARAPLHAKAEDQEEAQDIWKQAYQMELDRNQLLREKLIQANQDEEPPEACEVDWELNYQSIRACNAAIEMRLRGMAPRREEDERGASSSKDETDVGVPVLVTIPLDERKAKVEVFRLNGAGSLFLLVKKRLPLQFSLVRPETGELQGAWVVEAVFADGDVASDTGTSIMPGDVLHGFTAMAATMGTTTFDSGVSGKVQKFVLTSLLSGMRELEDAIYSNEARRQGPDVVLLLERSKSALYGVRP